MGIIADLLGGVSEDLYDKIPGDVKDFYTSPLITPTADGQAGNIRDSQYAYLTSPDITFKPFTVTGPSGNIDVTVDEFGQASTNYELSEMLNMQLSSVCARVRELQLTDHIDDSGLRRETT